MKLVSSLVVVLLSFCFCVDSRDILFNGENQEGIDAADSLNELIAERCPLINPNKTSLDDLNVDCVTLIADHFEYPELINVSKINENFRLAAAHTFKVKYAQHQIVITDTFEVPREENVIDVALNWLGLNTKKEDEKKGPTHSVKEGRIKIMDYQMIVDTFKNLEITHLNLIYANSDHKPAKLLGELIGTYRADTLTSVQFDLVKKNTLEFIRKPLTNVKKVQFGRRHSHPATEQISYAVFGNIYWKFKKDVLPINELFPALEELYVRWWPPLEYFYAHMPNLKHLFINGDTKSNLKRDYIEILQKNPQIESLEVDGTLSNTLEMIKSLLPNLKTLSLFEHRTDGPVHFENVTSFSVKVASSPPTNLTFSNLQRLEIDRLNSHFLAPWVNFLREHDQITEFELSYNKFSDDPQGLEQMLDCLPNLQKLYIHLRVGAIDNTYLIHLLNNRADLRLIHLTFGDEYYKSQINLNPEGLNKPWDIKSNANDIILERLEEEM